MLNYTPDDFFTTFFESSLKGIATQFHPPLSAVLREVSGWSLLIGPDWGWRNGFAGIAAFPGRASDPPSFIIAFHHYKRGRTLEITLNPASNASTVGCHVLDRHVPLAEDSYVDCHEIYEKLALDFDWQINHSRLVDDARRVMTTIQHILSKHCGPYLNDETWPLEDGSDRVGKEQES